VTIGSFTRVLKRVDNQYFVKFQPYL